MSQQIASLFATVGADISGFMRGMTSVKQEFKSIAPGVEMATKNVQGFMQANAGLISVAGGVAAGLVGVGVAAAKAYGEFQTYAGQVRDLSIATGSTAEESSRLLQVLDDYQITAADVTAGMRAMKEKGIVPTVDSLASLSEQFLAIEDPAKRLQFAQDNLGRSSAKFLNILSQGPDVIRDLNGAVNENLILTDEQIKNAERQRLAVDALSDTWQGFKVQAGAAIGEIIIAQQDMTTQMSYLTTVSGATASQIVDSHGRVKDSFQPMVAEYERASAMGSFWAGVLEGEVTPALEDLTAATQEVSAANQGMLGLIGESQSQLDSYRETQTALREEMALLKQEYQDDPWHSTAEQEEYTASVNRITDAMRQNELAHLQAGKSIVFSLVQQKMAVDGLSDTEMKALTGMGVQMGIFSQEAVDMAENFMAAADNVVNNAGAMDEALRDPLGAMIGINEKVEGLESKSGSMWDYYVNIHTTGNFPNLPGGQAVTVGIGSGGGNQMQIREAEGGLIIGPGSGTSDSISALLSNGEFVVRQAIVSRPGVLKFLEALNSGEIIRGYAAGGRISSHGGSTGGINQQQRDRDRAPIPSPGGGGVSLPGSTSEAAPEATTSMAASMGLSGGPVGQSVAASTSIQATNSVQSVRELKSIDQKLGQLIAMTPTASDIASAMQNQASLYS